MKVAVDNQLKNSQVFWPARVAVSGQEVTPGGAIELAEILGKDETLKRIDFSIDLLNK